MTGSVTVLNAPGDYRDWDKLVAHCETLPGLSHFERAQAKRALVFLRNEFGPTFLESAFPHGHPLLQYFINLAPWTRKWLTQFAHDLEKVRKDPKYSQLITRLSRKDTYAEADQVLHVAARFVDSGFAVTLDPEIRVRDDPKIPDLMLVDPATSERLFAEVTALTQSTIEREAFDTGERLCAPLWRAVPFLNYAVRIHKLLAQKHLEHVAGLVESLVASVREEGVFRSLVLEGVLEIGVAPHEDTAILQAWAAEHGLDVGTVTGPPYSVDEIGRVKRKLRDKADQLPNEWPNIVVVFAHHLFLSVGDLRMAVGELEEALYKYPHFLGLVVTASHLGHGPSEMSMFGEHVHIRRVTCDLVVEEYLILLNRFCDHRVSPSAIAKLYGSFRPH